jgi:uncharacterized protein (DUF58 family)
VRHATISVVTRFERRGLHRLQPPVLIVADRLGLARSMHTGSSEARHVLVLPRISPVQWREPTRAGRSPRTAGRAAPEPHGAFDVDGLRPYRPGTPASRIYWPALAKGAGLLERSLQADSELRPLVILDARGTADDAEPLDAAVRAAASLTVALARIGGCALLLPGERRASEIDSDLGGWSGAHARLALVEGGPDAPPPRLTARSQVGALVYVATRPRERLLARLGAAGAAACVLVLPTQCTQRMVGAASFEVAGCYGFVLRAGSGRATTGLRPARERVA